MAPPKRGGDSKGTSLTADQKLSKLREELVLLAQEQRKTEQENLFLSRSVTRERTAREKAEELVKKLETLCRELQARNKDVMNETKTQGKLEEQKRNALQEKFSGSLESISKKIEEHSQERLVQIKENAQLKTSLKSFVEEYETKTKYYEQKIKMLTLEAQLAETKFKEKQLMCEEAEKSSDLYKAKAEALAAAETELRKQLTAYIENFETLKKSLDKTTQQFKQYEGAITKAEKRAAKLSEANALLKQQAANAEQKLIVLVEKGEADTAVRNELIGRNKKLELLCRTMQHERKELLAKAGQTTEPTEAAAAEPAPQDQPAETT